MSQPAPDYLDIAKNLFTVIGSIVAFLTGIPRIIHWWSRPHLKIRDVGIYYKASTHATTVYTYQEGNKARAVTADVTVDFKIENPKRRLKRKQVHAMGVRWAAEISDARTGTQVFTIYQDTYSNVLGPASTIPKSQQISVNLSSPEYRVYVYADCKEGSSTTFDNVVKVTRRREVTVRELLEGQT